MQRILIDTDTHSNTQRDTHQYSWKGLVRVKISDTPFLEQPVVYPEFFGADWYIHQIHKGATMIGT